ncbi:hypothetical protein LguiB_013368 [Lonicera macranthoides]
MRVEHFIHMGQLQNFVKSPRLIFLTVTLWDVQCEWILYGHLGLVSHRYSGVQREQERVGTGNELVALIQMYCRYVYAIAGSHG